MRRFLWNLVQEWEQVRLTGARWSGGVVTWAPWWERLEWSARYAILGSTHREWFRLQSDSAVCDTESPT